MRYARQSIVRGVGDAGQRAIAASVVRVDGRGLAAEVCVRYLAGAGVGRLIVAPELVDTGRSINSTVAVEANAVAIEPADALKVTLVSEEAAPSVAPVHEDAVMRGAVAARWALARALGGGKR